jgi:hypothetical protein
MRVFRNIRRVLVSQNKVSLGVNFKTDVETSIFDEKYGLDLVKFIIENPIGWVLSWFKLSHDVKHKITVNFICPIEVNLSLPYFFIRFYAMGKNRILWIFDVKETFK